MGDFKSDLGSFAGLHMDGFDYPGSLTAMVNLSRLPSPINSGYFYLFELGVCWKLPDFSTLVFSGLRWHGSDPPTYPHSHRLSSDSYRCQAICYCPSSILEGKSLGAFAAIGETLFTTRPEMGLARSALVILCGQPFMMSKHGTSG